MPNGDSRVETPKKNNDGLLKKQRTHQLIADLKAQTPVQFRLSYMVMLQAGLCRSIER